MMYESPPPSLNERIRPVRISTMSPGSHLDARPRSRLVEFVTRDLVPAGELVDSSHRSDIEEHAATDKRAHVLDPEHGRTAERVTVWPGHRCTASLRS